MDLEASNDESRSRRTFGLGSVEDDRFVLVIVFMKGFLGADCDCGIVNDFGLTLTDTPFLSAFNVFACCSAVFTSLKKFDRIV